MNTSAKQNPKSRLKGLMPMMLFAAALLLAAAAPKVFPPGSTPYGKSYAQWSADAFKWALELPAEGHPFFACPASCDAGQTGPVWFLSGGPTECACTIPVGKSLCFPLVDVECSSLEAPPFFGGDATEQSACAQFFGDHVVVASLFCEIDGVSVTNLQNYRFLSPQFAFTAPTPWVFGEVGGEGTAVSDGYWVIVAPMSKGAHTIHFGGAVHFSVDEGDPFDADFGIDTTYNLTVQ